MNSSLTSPKLLTYACSTSTELRSALLFLQTKLVWQIIKFCFSRFPNYNEGEHKIGSIGKPALGVNVKIHEPDSNGIGEIAVNSRNVFMGYLEAEDKTREAFTEDGWFLTGDLGTKDKEGYLKIQGRKKVE